MDLLGMSDDYQHHCLPQYGCHQLAQEYLISAARECCPNEDQITIGIFGCSSGNNDLLAVEKFILPTLYSRFPDHSIEIFMIDISKTVWTTSRRKLTVLKSDYSNIFIQGIMANVYTPLFDGNSLDLVLSFSCLHWLNKNPVPLSGQDRKNDFCWSLLGNEKQRKIDDYSKSQLTKFLWHRCRELRSKGQLVVSFDGYQHGHPHHFQGPSEAVSEAIQNILSRDQDSYTCSSQLESFFIPTSPRSLDSVSECLLDNNSWEHSKTLLDIQTVKCPFWEKRIGSLSFNSDISSEKINQEYSYSITNSIMSCIGPIMKSTPSTESKKMIDSLQQEVVNIIYQNPVKRYSTEGKVIILKCNKI